MDIQSIQDYVTLRRLRIAGNQSLEVRKGILLGARRQRGRLDDVSGHHIEIEKPGKGAMPDVLEFASQYMSYLA